MLTVGRPASAGFPGNRCGRCLPHIARSAEPLAPRHRDGHPGTKPFSTASTEAGSTVAPREGSTAFPTRDAFPRHAPTLRKGSPAPELAPVCRIPVLFALAFTIARRRSPSGTRPSIHAARHRLTSSAACHDPRTHPRAAVLAPGEGCRAERVPEDPLRPGAPARGSTTRVASPSPTASEHPLSPDGADAGWESERRSTRQVEAPLPDAHREAGRHSTRPGAFHQQPSRALSLSHRARPALPRLYPGSAAPFRPALRGRLDGLPIRTGSAVAMVGRSSPFHRHRPQHRAGFCDQRSSRTHVPRPSESVMP